MTLNPSLELAQQLGRTYRAMLAAFEQRVGHCLPRWRILFQLHSQQQGCSQRELAEALDMDPGALTRQLKAMEQQGLIGRRMSVLDNRQTLVSLTEAGQQSVRQALPEREIFFAELFTPLSEAEQRLLQQQLQQLERQARQLALL